MLQVFGDSKSGNCLKVKWALDWLGRPYEWTEVDIMTGTTRTKEFLAMNTAGQVPVVRLDDGRTLAQSNAILVHLLDGTELIPGDAFERAKMFEWLFWEQYSHEPCIAVRRFQRLYLGKKDEEIDPKLLEKGNAALQRLDDQLGSQPFLTGERPTVADLSLLPYTRAAHEGGYDLAPWRHVRAWIEQASRFFRVPTLEQSRAWQAGLTAAPFPS